MAYFTDEQIAQAKSISIEDYILKNNIADILQNSNKYMKISIAGHDSIVINKVKNYFVHNGNSQDKNARGSIIDFIQYFENKSFYEAVDTLLNDTYTVHDSRTYDKEDTFVYPKQNDVTRITQAKDYLIHVRQLDEEIVDYCFENGYAVQNKYNAVVFRWFEHGQPTNKIVGGSLQGTVYNEEKYGKRGTFKGVLEYSKQEVGFHITKGIPNHIYVFESTIDALSYWSLHKETLTNHFKLVSMDGLKDSVVFHHLRETLTHPDTKDVTLTLCVDNDKPGIDFAQKIEEKLNQSKDVYMKGNQQYRFTHELDIPKNFKDYNEQLVSLKQGQVFLGRQVEQKSIVPLDEQTTSSPQLYVSFLYSENKKLTATYLERQVIPYEQFVTVLYQENNRLLNLGYYKTAFDLQDEHGQVLVKDIRYALGSETKSLSDDLKNDLPKTYLTLAQRADKVAKEAMYIEKSIDKKQQQTEKHIIQPEKKQDKIKLLFEQLKAGIQGVFESERYKEYLKTLSKFHQYSANNILLIMQQNPNASLVAGYNKWKEVGRYVKKNEKAIQIIALAGMSVREMETDKLDDYGKPVVEKISYPRYKTAYVFDISQTDGKEIGLTKNLVGDVKNYDTLFQSLVLSTPFRVSFGNLGNDVKGVCRIKTKEIILHENLSQVHTIKTLIHEMTHADLHSQPRMEPFKQEQREIEAESVAFVVCDYYGIDTSDYSFPYLLSWSKDRELTQLKESLETIQKQANELIERVDKHMQELTKDKSLTHDLLSEKKSLTEKITHAKTVATDRNTTQNCHEKQNIELSK
ncbi:toprim domain-containing protein [Granulicatella sp. zg-ZJ]|uniref:toprim domain-containing protein n=1 Tax=Granulicatella sp. zg-ZJ TaxID=2678504 RepID=UPI0013D1A893|nr:toprim domain-containing protein [Granulicatella sp. zg-ZJ]MBS4749594.1 toprim domain-containing protein [Carnobacteriaceae bacterium zg-ZUI78]